MNAPARPASRLTPSHKSKNPATESAAPKTSALVAVILPEGSGRIAVRRILRSASRSYHWLSAAVPEASSPVPIIVWSSESSGTLRRNSHQFARLGSPKK